MRNDEIINAIRKFMGDAELGQAASFHVPHVSDYQSSLVMRCGGGYLVAYPAGDPGCFSEIGVDFVSESGQVAQLAVVGRDEGDDDYHPAFEPDYQPMHVYGYDGQTGQVESVQYVNIDEDTDWWM